MSGSYAASASALAGLSDDARLILTLGAQAEAIANEIIWRKRMVRTSGGECLLLARCSCLPFSGAVSRPAPGPPCQDLRSRLLSLAVGWASRDWGCSL